MTMRAISRVLAAFVAASLFACSPDEEKDGQAVWQSGHVLSEGEARAFFNTHSCNACHEVDELRIGPAYRDVAMRYADERDTRLDWLAQKIIHGGAGSWGNVPMVTNSNVTPDEARAIAIWILSLDTERPADK